jgi:alkane 1-monooxygenase
MAWLGRLLMASVLYEHFSTEHVRGHHARVGTAEDPATARFGESYQAFFRRTVPAQFRSAWRLETHRMGDVDMPLFDRRQLHNRVLHGVVFEWSAAFAIWALLGVGAFAFHLLQSLSAVRLLEAVNYFEHWGLVRRGKKPSPVDSWDTDSRFTLYTLVGLSRHADHHAYATRPYQQLRHWEESPKLPSGYFGTVDMVLLRNRKFREQMAAELERRKLGPFAESDAA